MRIVIETDGSHAGTKIAINDEAIDTAEFSFSTRQAGRGAAKLQMQRFRPGDPDRCDFISYYSEDFKKIDESLRINQEAKKNE